MFVVLAPEVSSAEVRVDGCRVRSDADRLLVIAYGAPVALLRVVDRAEVINCLRILLVELDSLFVILFREVEQLELMKSDPDLVGYDRRVRGCLAIGIDRLAVHL